MGKDTWEYNELDVLERAQKLYETDQIRFTHGWGQKAGSVQNACLLHSIAIAGEQLYGRDGQAGGEQDTARKYRRVLNLLAKAIRPSFKRGEGDPEDIIVRYNDERITTKRGAINRLKKARELFWG